jgi:hypothetical protein
MSRLACFALTLLNVLLPGCTRVPASADAAGDTGADASGGGAVLASEVGTGPTSAEILRACEGQLRFADSVSDSLKRTALVLDDERLDRQISAIDEQLGIMRATLDRLRAMPRTELLEARVEWDLAVEQVRSLCRRARALSDELEQ